MNDLSAMIERYHDARNEKAIAQSHMRQAEADVVGELIDRRDTYLLRVDWCRVGKN